MKLRELTGQYLELSNMATDLESDLTPELIADTLSSIQGDFKEKALSVTHVIADMDCNIDVIDVEIQRLQSRKKVLQNSNDRIREYLKSNMIASEITKITCPLFTITLAKGRDVVSIDNEDEIDNQYMTVKTSISPDKREILKALKDDPDSVKGASLAKTEPSLRIK
jgi:uncharacterized protein YeeX (DUF496 family)|tara:strand:+ start:4724 stop:5224 length:501 start_codon:yes stop_codon:yes gene_type:complete